MAGGGSGNYSREVLILNISVKGRRLFEGGDYSRKYGTPQHVQPWIWFHKTAVRLS